MQICFVLTPVKMQTRATQPTLSCLLGKMLPQSLTYHSASSICLYDLTLLSPTCHSDPAPPGHAAGHTARAQTQAFVQVLLC